MNQKLIEIFERADNLYGPYNALLNKFFNLDNGFVIAPQAYQIRDSTQNIDCYIEYVISVNQHPILVLDIKPASTIEGISDREDADVQIRRRLTNLVEKCPISTLRGISALGTKLSFYTVNKTDMTIYPLAIACHPTHITDVAPADRWNIDLLNPEGYNRLVQLFGTIIRECHEQPIITND